MAVNKDNYTQILVTFTKEQVGVQPAFWKKTTLSKKIISCPYGQLIYIILVIGSNNKSFPVWERLLLYICN